MTLQDEFSNRATPRPTVPAPNLFTATSRFSRRDAARTGAILAALSIAPRAVSAATMPPRQTMKQLSTPNGENQENVEIALPFDPFGQPVSLDPHRALDWGPLWVMLPYVWSGLLAFDENGAVVPDLAEEVAPGDDASVWTATLREGLTFASGADLTAQHFIDSWLRALDPSNLSPMTGYMKFVDGYDAYIAGESTDIGFEAKDDRTIEIRLSEPVSYFPAQLATFVWAVIDLNVVAESPQDFALQDAGAGQWRFTEFVDNDHLVMVPNPAYWDGNSPSVTRVTWPFMDSIDIANSGLDLYRDDQLVSLDVPISLLPTITDDQDLAADLVSLEPQGSTIAIGMDFNQEPFNDIRIRQAVAAAIDKESWATDTWQGTFVPAMSFTPPSTAQIAAYEPPTAPAFDPDHAKDLIADAEFATGDAQTEITYYQPATDSAEDQERNAALLQMIADNTGITITHDVSMTAEQITALQSDLGGRQFDLVWWWSVTDTPSLLSTVGQSTSPYMQGWFNWSPDIESAGGDTSTASTDFDEHSRNGDQELDQDTRNEEYAAAEKLLLDNAVYVPLGHWVPQYIQKPWLRGTRQGPWSGRIPVRIDKDVTVSGKPEDR
jgi:oligopeptide transport system substrate-binding protein